MSSISFAGFSLSGLSPHHVSHTFLLFPCMMEIFSERETRSDKVYFWIVLTFLLLSPKGHEENKRRSDRSFLSFKLQQQWSHSENMDMMPPPDTPFRAIRSPSLPAMARRRSQHHSLRSDSVPNFVPNPLQPRIVLTNADSEDKDSLKSKSSRSRLPNCGSSRVSPSPCVSTLSSCGSINKSCDLSFTSHRSLRSNSVFSQNRLWEQSQMTLDSSKDQLKVTGKSSLPDDGEGKLCYLNYNSFLVFENTPFLPTHLSPSTRSRNLSLTTHMGSQTHLNTSLSFYNMNENNKASRMCSSNMSLRSPSEKEHMRRSERGRAINTRERVLISGVVNRWTSS